jgi:translation initiation factor 2 alpha subunit (eIF-2alpha)
MWEIKTRKPRRYTLLVQASNIRTALKMVREAGHSEVKSIEKVN